MIAPGRHAALLLDQTGWHLSAKLVVPENITLVPLHPSAPNSIRWRTSGNSCATTGSPTAFSKYEDMLDYRCFAWNKLIDMPWKIMSIGIRE
jgi:hypothetical protein